MPKILSQDQVDFYFREGFLHVENVYPAATVDKIRDLAAKALEDGTWYKAPRYANEGVTSDIYRTMPELIELTYTENYVQIFEDLFGPDAVTLPEPALHRNRFYYWHKDSTFLDEQGEDFHWNEDFNAIMVAMYMQDNDPTYGGGITVVPRTHKDGKDLFHKIFKQNIFQRAFTKIQKIFKVSHFDRLDQHPQLTRVPSKKGDLVLLDLRIDHKGSTPKIISEEREKYALFNIVSNSPKYVKELNRCLRARPAAYYSQYLKHDKELPEKLVAKAKELDFKVDF